MNGNSDYSNKSPSLPYGPVKGILQGLELLQRTSPQKVDGDFLRGHRVAPGNEYKVVGALKFLGVIDEYGRPTPRAQSLKAKGPAFTLALQELVRESYRALLAEVSLREATKEQIYNYFILRERMGAEMTNKATRFFLELCRQAQMELSPALAQRRGRPSLKRPSDRGRRVTGQGPQAGRGVRRQRPQPSTDAPLPLVFAITPELARMDEEELTELFRKMRTALQRSAESPPQ